MLPTSPRTGPSWRSCRCRRRQPIRLSYRATILVLEQDFGASTDLRSGRVGTPREAEEIELVPWRVVVDEEVVALAHILGQTLPKRSLGNALANDDGNPLATFRPLKLGTNRRAHAARCGRTWAGLVDEGWRTLPAYVFSSAPIAVPTPASYHTTCGHQFPFSVFPLIEMALLSLAMLDGTERVPWFEDCQVPSQHITMRFGGYFGGGGGSMAGRNAVDCRLLSNLCAKRSREERSLGKRRRKYGKVDIGPG